MANRAVNNFEPVNEKQDRIFSERSEEIKMDYSTIFYLNFLNKRLICTLFLVDLHRNFTPSFNALSNTPAVVEIVLVVDKDLGDVFRQNYNAVVDYLAVYFADVNMRYKTLPSVDISFQVNAVLIMKVSKDDFLKKISYPSRADVRVLCVRQHVNCF